jgi:hypothetical protein
VKPASAAALAILSGGMSIRADLYAITLTSGASYYFTSFDQALTAAIYPSVAQNTYQMGYVIMRGSTEQKVGLDSQELELKIYPRPDNPGGAPLIAGYSILQAGRLGILDNAIITYAKLFMNKPAYGANLDTSPGAIGWFQGLVSDLSADRAMTTIKLSANIITLNQVQMPKNLYQATCSHTVYDAGCTLLKASFTKTGAVTGTPSTFSFASNMGAAYALGYFSLGVLTFTSGANKSFSATVKSYDGAGNFALQIPMPAPIAAGDTYSVYPGCSRLMNVCSGKFNNLAHFKGMPFIPVPETLYDGGTAGLTQQGPLTNKPIGSGPGGRLLPQK